MKKIFLSYTTGALFLVLGLAGFTQAINPSFLAMADAVDVSKLSSSLAFAVIGAVFFILGFFLIVFKVMKGNRRNG